MTNTNEKMLNSTSNQKKIQVILAPFSSWTGKQTNKNTMIITSVEKNMGRYICSQSDSGNANWGSHFGI